VGTIPKEADVKQALSLAESFEGMPVADADGTGERRTSRRAATIFTIGKIAIAGRARPCIVRDISEGGMRVQLPNPPVVGTAVDVEMRGLEPRRAQIRWIRDDSVGLAFETPCTIEEIFGARTSRDGQVARQPRFDIEHAADLDFGGTKRPVTIIDLSIGGAKLAISARLPKGTHACLHLGLGIERDSLAGTICWMRDGTCGIRFARPLGHQALADMLNRMEQVSPPNED
jgi:hypothetical protein